MRTPASIALAILGFLVPPAVFLGVVIALGRLHHQFDPSLPTGAEALILLLAMGVFLLASNRVMAWLNQPLQREALAPFWLGTTGLLLPPALFCGAIQAWMAFRLSKGREPLFFLGIAAALFLMMAIIAWTTSAPLVRFMPALTIALTIWTMLRQRVKTGPASVVTFCILHCVTLVVCVLLA